MLEALNHQELVKTKVLTQYLKLKVEGNVDVLSFVDDVKLLTPILSNNWKDFRVC